MKQKYIADLTLNEDITEFYMVKSVMLKVGSNRKTYLDLLLCDKTGEINGKKWDIPDEEIAGIKRIQEGSIIKVIRKSKTTQEFVAYRLVIGGGEYKDRFAEKMNKWKVEGFDEGSS